MIASNGKESELRKSSTVVILPVVYDNVESLNLSRSERAALDILVKAATLTGSRVYDLKAMKSALGKYSKPTNCRKPSTEPATRNSAGLVPRRAPVTVRVCAACLAFCSVLS